MKFGGRRPLLEPTCRSDSTNNFCCLVMFLSLCCELCCVVVEMPRVDIYDMVFIGWLVYPLANCDVEMKRGRLRQEPTGFSLSRWSSSATNSYADAANTSEGFPTHGLWVSRICRSSTPRTLIKNSLRTSLPANAFSAPA